MSSTSSTWSTCCAQRGGAHIQVFGGGGGVIVPAEIRELQAYGVTRIYSPEDGQRMGLAGMIGEMVMRSDADLSVHAPKSLAALQRPPARAWRALAQLITALENGQADAALEGRAAGRGAQAAHARCSASPAPAAPASAA